MFSILKSIQLAALNFFCSVILCFTSWSQLRHSDASFAEKIYLQLGSTVYTNDETVWFKAIVANAHDHSPTLLSGVLYTELVGPDEHIVERKLVKLVQGIGDGFFQLNKNHAPGVYLVRAYTEWDKNFGTDFFYKQYITIFNADGKPKENPISNVSLVQGGTQRRLRVQFNPFTIDSFSGKEITVCLTFEDKKDTVSVKKSSKNEYGLDYPLPEGSSLVTLQIQNNRNFNDSRTILLDTNHLDFQFFPESGELVQGMPALLGFKALGGNGRGVPVTGEIVDGKGNIITSFASNRLGMGSVSLVRVDSAAGYTARVRTAGREGPTLYSLPLVVAKGNILSVQKEGKDIAVKAVSNYLLTDSVLIRATCRGAVYYDFKGGFKKGALTFLVPSHLLPEGIIEFTLIVEAMKPVATRLYFNRRPETRLILSVNTDKPTYLQREKTKLSIETKDADGKPVAANISLLVMNKTQTGSFAEQRQNILSCFLLSSDLKGEIEAPGFYFSGDSDGHKDLDALLLTQGWQKYHYLRDTVKFVFQPETDLVVSGTVKGGLFNNNTKKEADLTMLTFGKPASVQNLKTDTLGRFRFVLNEEYGENLNLLLQTADKKGKQRPYTIVLDQKKFPPVSFNHRLSVERPDSIIQAYVQKNVERKRAEDDFKRSTEGHIMQEVIIKTPFMSPERKQVTDKYGKATTIIDGQAIRDKEEKWSYGLYSVLLFNFPDKINIVRAGNGTLYARHYNREVTLVVIDGMTVRLEDYVFIPSIPPSEVKSFEIIEYAKNFTSLYCEVFPQACVHAPPTGNVIAIYTYAGKGIFGVQPTVGITKATVPVFAAPREFYAPKYEAIKEREALKPDLRTLVHWAPVIVTDSSGRAAVSFYNADLTGNMQIVVEAISANGEIGYKTLDFEVKKKNH